MGSPGQLPHDPSRVLDLVGGALVRLDRALHRIELVRDHVHLRQGRRWQSVSSLFFPAPVSARQRGAPRSSSRAHKSSARRPRLEAPLSAPGYPHPAPWRRRRRAPAQPCGQRAVGRGTAALALCLGAAAPQRPRRAGAAGSCARWASLIRATPPARLDASCQHSPAVGSARSLDERLHNLGLAQIEEGLGREARHVCKCGFCGVFVLGVHGGAGRRRWRRAGSAEHSRRPGRKGTTAASTDSRCVVLRRRARRRTTCGRHRVAGEQSIGEAPLSLRPSRHALTGAL